jgi:hypothetical protein
LNSASAFPGENNNLTKSTLQERKKDLGVSDKTEDALELGPVLNSLGIDL